MTGTPKKPRTKDDIILSFDQNELAGWIKNRLGGKDKYFSIIHGHDSDLSQFMIRAYKRIDDKNFKKRFLDVVVGLVSEMDQWSSQKIIENNLYIYELLSLCLQLKDYNQPMLLFRLAKSGKFKGVKAYDTELHMALLSTMAVHDLSGSYRFWWTQIEDASNPFYANAAFYALLDNQYSLDVIFEKMDIYIDRFEGKKQLKRAVRALCNDFSLETVSAKFRKIRDKLDDQQKEAVIDAFESAGHKDIKIWYN